MKKIFLITTFCIIIQVRAEIILPTEDYITLKNTYKILQQKIVNLSARSLAQYGTQYANLDTEIGIFCKKAQSYHSPELDSWCTKLQRMRKK